MPSPVKTGFYRRKDGAWVKIKGRFVKVGANKYPNKPHYAKKTPTRDRKIRGRKAPTRKALRRYPHHYD